MKNDTITIHKGTSVGPSSAVAVRCCECGIVLPARIIGDDVSITTFCQRCKKTVNARRWPT